MSGHPNVDLVVYPAVGKTACHKLGEHGVPDNYTTSQGNRLRTRTNGGSSRGWSEYDDREEKSVRNSAKSVMLISSNKANFRCARRGIRAWNESKMENGDRHTQAA